MLSRILFAIVDLSTTRYWPEFSALIWTLIENYRAEMHTEPGLLHANEEDDKRTPKRVWWTHNLNGERDRPVETIVLRVALQPTRPLEGLLRAIGICRHAWELQICGIYDEEVVQCSKCGRNRWPDGEDSDF